VRKLRRGGDCGTYLAAIDGLAAVQGIAGNLREALDRIDSQPGGSPARDARVAALRTFGAYLTAYGIAEGDVFADFGMIRPYAVYDGIVHELHHDAAGPGKAIGGGGQYDAGWVLASPDRPAEALPGCGFAFGVERLLLAAEAEGTLVAASRSPADCLVTTAGNTPPGEAMALARILRAAGLAVRLDLPARSLKKELSDAAAAGIGFVAICGEKERAEGRVTVRAMASREEAGVPAGEVAAWIAARSGR
jgi:histidyl-tRNA synthetase